MYAFARHADNRNDEVKLSGAIAKLIDEDPSLRFEQDPELQQSLLWGQGEMHLRVALDRLRTKYNVEVDGRPPQTPYRETIRKCDPEPRPAQEAERRPRPVRRRQDRDPPARARRGLRVRRQGRRRRRAAPVHPGGRGRRPGVPAARPARLSRGRRRVTLYDGQFHSVDSSELAFKLATALALKEGLPKCEPVLLEPILSVDISVPVATTPRRRCSW